MLRQIIYFICPMWVAQAIKDIACPISLIQGQTREVSLVNPSTLKR